MSNDIKKYIEIINEQTRGHVMPRVSTIDSSAPWVKKQMIRAAEFTRAINAAVDNREKLNVIRATDLTTVRSAFAVGRYPASIYKYDTETGNITLTITPGPSKELKLSDGNIKDFEISMFRNTNNVQTYYFKVNPSRLSKIYTVPNPKFADYKKAGRRRNKEIDTPSLDALSSLWNSKPTSQEP